MTFEFVSTLRNGTDFTPSLSRLETTLERPLLPPATKLRQGYIFTGICDSVHIGHAWPGGRPWLGGMHGKRGGCITGGCAWLRHTVNEWAVHILLECILVQNLIVQHYCLDKCIGYLFTIKNCKRYVRTSNLIKKGRIY